MRQERLSRVRKALTAKGLTQMILCDPESISYLTDIYIDPHERFFALYLRVDGRQKLFANKLFVFEEQGMDVVWLNDTDDVGKTVAAHVDGEKDMGIDKAMQARFLIPLQEQLPSMRCRLSSECVDWCRAVKDEQELALMRVASQINDAAMREVEKRIQPGVTELELAEAITDSYQRLAGATPSFDIIVAFGANAADPHHVTDETVLREGDCVLIDTGCRKDGYCSDMTRTYFCRSASEKQKAVHDLVRRANERAESLVRPGVRLCDIDAAARGVISDAGYGAYFTHRLGHFIGREVHEYGDVSAAFDRPVEEGMIFSIEPGVYLPGEFGVRIEDLVVVTRDGCEVLNQLDKKWKIF